MPSSPEGFEIRLARLKADVVEQGRRVQAQVERALDAVFGRDPELAQSVIDSDDVIDRVDVELEGAAVAILSDATRVNAHLEERQTRDLLNVVKINNELERIADLGVVMAERVKNLSSPSEPIPASLRVMANSVVGILRDVNGALEGSDAHLARLVLRSEDAVGSFKEEITRDAERQIADGRMTVHLAFFLNGIAAQLVAMADHSTNIAEQVIYAETGAIVRHVEDAGWIEMKARESS